MKCKSKIDVKTIDNTLIIVVDGMETIFKILKPKLLEEIVIGFKDCKQESQVLIYSTCLVSMGAVVIV